MTSLVPAAGQNVTPQAGSTALAMPDGSGAAGEANLSMVRMAALLAQAMKAIKIFEDVSDGLLVEVTVTEDMANYLTASLGERISLEQLRIIATMLKQVAEATAQVIENGNDSVRAALAANFQVLVAQEALHSTGADGAYIDSQRRAG